MKTVRSSLPQGLDPEACPARMPKIDRADAKALAGRVDGLRHAGRSLQARVRLHG